MEVLRSIRQLEALRDEWNHLAEQQEHALLRHEWFVSAARTLHDPEDLAVIVGRSGGTVDAIAPLAPVPAYPTNFVQILGAAALHEPTGLLVSGDEASEKLLDTVFRLGRPVGLQRLTVSSAGLEQARALGRRRGFVLLKHAAPSLAVVFKGDGAEQLDRLPAKLRYDLKRARTRAGRDGEVRVHALAPTPADVDESFDLFMRIEASGWKGRGGSALVARPRLQAFFRLYARLMAESGLLRVFVLHVADAPVAAQLGVEVFERLWILKTAYDESMARCSPGFLLNAEAIWYAASRGLRSYEFLGGPEQWEQRWRPESRPTATIVFYPRTVAGCVGASVHIAGRAFSRLYPQARCAIRGRNVQ